MNRLTFVKKIRHGYGLFHCSCGNDKEIKITHVKANLTKSCGCFRSQIISELKTKHGLCNSVEYRAWYLMINRCENTSSADYIIYGKRGITVCRKWRNDFLVFFKDMGPRPSGHSLDRINPNGNYSKRNCRWATIKQQARNKRNTLFFSIGKERRPLAEWCEITNVNYKWAWELLKTDKDKLKLLLSSK